MFLNLNYMTQTYDFRNISKKKVVLFSNQFSE